ncbi:MAG TPA: thioredoxin family protein [Syntrophorhabdaceae bacterium]|nr:thioredoxin family protein [Syntrophorhabdaceae bacterium]
MGIVKIFYKDDCPMCPMAKKLRDTLQEQNVAVNDFNVGTTDGLAEATFYRVMALPTILIEDEAENSVQEWRGSVPHIDEVMNVVQRA